jgi:hypothetical protein
MLQTPKRGVAGVQPRIANLEHEGVGMPPRPRDKLETLVATYELIRRRCVVVPLLDMRDRRGRKPLLGSCTWETCVDLR